MQDNPPYRRASVCRHLSSTNSIIPYADEDFETDDFADADKNRNETFSKRPGLTLFRATSGAMQRNTYRDLPSLSHGVTDFETRNKVPLVLPLTTERPYQNAPAVAAVTLPQTFTMVNVNPGPPISTSSASMLRGMNTSSTDNHTANVRRSSAESGQSASSGSSSNRFYNAFKSIFVPKVLQASARSPVVFHATVRHSLSACGSESMDSTGQQQAAQSCRADNARNENELYRHNTMTTVTSTSSGGKIRRPPLLRGFSRLRPITTHTPCICRECRACVTSSFDELDHRHALYDSTTLDGQAADQTGEVFSQEPIAQISRFHFAWTVGGLLTYLADFVTDISVAVEYKQEGHSWWVFWTLVFIILPSVVMAIYSCIWYFEDHRHGCSCDDPHVGSQCCKHASKKEWFIRILFMLIGMAPLLRYLEAVRQAWRVYKAAGQPVLQRNLYILYIWADADASMLRLFEAFLESAPQLVLQLYTVFKTGSRLDELSDLWDNKAFSIMFSWVSMAFTMVQFHRSLRAIRSTEKKQVRWYGSVMMFFWHLLFIGSRVLVIVAICSSAALMGPALVFVHWLLMFAWIFSQGTTFCSERFTWQEYAYDACIAVIYIFCFFNVKDTKTVWRYVIFYCIAVPENIAGVVWYFNFSTVPHGGHRRTVVLLAVLTMMIAGIFLFQLPYYYFLHPKRGTLSAENAAKRKQLSPAQTAPALPTEANGAVDLNLLSRRQSQEAAEVSAEPVAASVTWNRVLSTNASEDEA